MSFQHNYSDSENSSFKRLKRKVPRSSGAAEQHTIDSSHQFAQVDPLLFPFDMDMTYGTLVNRVLREKKIRRSSCPTNILLPDTSQGVSASGNKIVPSFSESFSDERSYKVSENNVPMMVNDVLSAAVREPRTPRSRKVTLNEFASNVQKKKALVTDVITTSKPKSKKRTRKKVITTLEDFSTAVSTRKQNRSKTNPQMNSDFPKRKPTRRQYTLEEFAIGVEQQKAYPQNHSSSATLHFTSVNNTRGGQTVVTDISMSEKPAKNRNIHYSQIESNVIEEEEAVESFSSSSDERVVTRHSPNTRTRSFNKPGPRKSSKSPKFSSTVLQHLSVSASSVLTKRQSTSKEIRSKDISHKHSLLLDLQDPHKRQQENLPKNKQSAQIEDDNFEPDSLTENHNIHYSQAKSNVIEEVVESLPLFSEDRVVTRHSPNTRTRIFNKPGPGESLKSPNLRVSASSVLTKHQSTSKEIRSKDISHQHSLLLDLHKRQQENLPKNKQSAQIEDDNFEPDSLTENHNIHYSQVGSNVIEEEAVESFPSSSEGRVVTRQSPNTRTTSFNKPGPGKSLKSPNLRVSASSVLTKHQSTSKEIRSKDISYQSLLLLDLQDPHKRQQENLPKTKMSTVQNEDDNFQPEPSTSGLQNIPTDTILQHFTPRTENQLSSQSRKSRATAKAVKSKPRFVAKKKASVFGNQSRAHFERFCNMPVENGAFSVVEEAVDRFMKNLVCDLKAYACHAQRKTVLPKDVVLLMKRQRVITKNHSLEFLAAKYLPMQYREEIIPCYFPKGKVYP